MTIDNRPQSSIYFEANTSAEASTGNCSKTIAARRHAKSPQGRGSAAQPRSWTGPCRRVSTGDQQHSGTFLIVLTFWLVILFIGFGLFAPSNLTVLAVLFVCAFSVSAAIFMVIEMDEAFTGVMRISSRPLLNALIVIGG